MTREVKLLKLNFVLPSIGLSGGVRVVLKYAELLEEKGHDVVIYVPIIPYNKHRNNNLLDYLQIAKGFIHNIKVFFITKEYRKLGLKDKLKLVPIVSNLTIRNADVSIATAWPTAYSVNQFNPSKGEKIYFVQDYEIWDNKALTEKTYFFDMHKIVISKWINEKLHELGAKEGEIIYNGLDISKFYCTKSKENARALKCLMLYHNLPKKGIDDGIRAFEYARKRHPEIELILFGMFNDPKYDGNYKYIFNPSEVELRNLYSNCDIFIFPSRNEGWGLTPIEAMACKCAVVGTNTGCFKDIGVNGYNVLLSEPGDIEGLGQSIVKLVENDSLRKEIGENGFDTALKLKWSDSVDKFNCYIENLIHKP